MLEGPPFPRELLELVPNFKTTRFESVFKSTKLQPRQAPVPLSTVRTLAPPPFTGLPAKSPTPPQSQTPAAPALAVPPVMTYARTAIAPRSVPTSSETQATRSNSTSSSSTASTIYHNKYGQRVDAPLKVSHTIVNSLRARKLCNNYHLLGDCSAGDLCKHEHGNKLSPQQLQALRYLARLNPCYYGLSCDDEYCIAGHRCIRDYCHTSECKFARAMHDVDTTIVETIKVS